MRQNSPTFFRTAFAPFVSICILLLSAAHARAQGDATNVRFTQGEVNDGAGVSLSVPLATYPGRGLDLPVNLSYSSSVWRVDHMRSVRNYIVTPPPYYMKQSVTQALFAEHSKAGWKSGLDLPQIEWPKFDEVYDYKGKPATCCFFDYRIAHVTIHMPDGSSHQFRKSDHFFNGSYIDVLCTFYAVDGSRMRYDSTGLDTGTLFMADGTRYVLGHPTSYLIDRNGNSQSYNENARQWTDTLGRVIANPIPADPQVQDYPYSLPGLGGGLQAYVFKWRKLHDALAAIDGNTPSLRHMATHYLPNPSLPPTDSNGGNFPQPHPGGESLFRSVYIPPEDETNPPPYPVEVLVVGNGESAGQMFDPVVLAEIVIPGGSSYKFAYNVYGEVSKVTYPTAAFESYENDPMISDLDEQHQPYVQANRKVSIRKLSVNGSGNDLATWRFSQTHSLFAYRMTSVIAPDNTRKEILKFDFPEPVDRTGKRYWPFGQLPSQNGMVFETRAYSASPNGTGGNLLKRDLTQYDESIFGYNYTAAGINPPFTNTVYAYRNARPSKTVSILFDGSGSALGSATEIAYDTTNEFTTGVDPTRSNSYHYTVVPNTPADEWGNTLAKDGPIHLIPIGALARKSETTFRNDAVYRDQNILGLASATLLRNDREDVVSQTEIRYDECPIYCAIGNRGLATSVRTWDSNKGEASDPDAYLVSHSKFDQYGNRIEATDAKGRTTITIYDSAYQAFPVQFITPVPDPTGQHGSNTAFTSRTTYDYTTGLMLTSVDANDQVTRFEYNDPLLRPTRVIAPNGQQTISEYGSGTSETTRWIKVRSQVDGNKWGEAISRYDGVGRTRSTERIDSTGNVFSETEYDVMGRVSRSTNPFKTGGTKQWTVSEYDDLGRTKRVTLPDDADTNVSYGLSTAGVLGTTKTVIDPAGRERTGIADAFGNMVRVYEGTVAQDLFTDYLFDAAGNLRRTTQGEQRRYFMYDSLGRVIYSKQPEQDANGSLISTDPVSGNSSWSEKHTYDDTGNLLMSVDPRNIATNGTYDNLDRLIRRDYSDATADVEMFYDGRGLGAVPAYSKGKATKVTSSVSETRNTSFDPMGRLLASEQRTTPEQRSGNQAPFSFSYVYNLSGGLVEETYPSGRVVRNTLNVDGELSQVQSRKNTSSGFFAYADAFEYNASGAIVKLQLGNGHWETSAYDPQRLQVTAIGLGVTPFDRNILNLEFAYHSDSQTNNNGAMRLQRISVPAAGSSPAFTATETYTYDPLNRLASSVETVLGNQVWKQNFSYDRYGNRRFAPGTTTLGYCPSSQCNPNISTATNRLSSTDGYGYDSSGSLTHDAVGSRFTYDAEGRQTEFFSSSNLTSSPNATYAYDADGRRVKKTVGTETTIFVYDAAGKLAAEYSTTVVPTSQATVSYATGDHLGSPRIITDQYGRVSSRKDFAAFGDEITSPQRTGGPTGNGYDPQNVRQDYTGYEKDAESGLEYAQARYYNTSHGRFTSVDPLTASATIRNPQTFNRYSYVMNSPYKFTDPLGLAADQLCGADKSRCNGGDDNEIGSTHISEAMARYDAGVEDLSIARRVNSQALESKEAVSAAIQAEGGDSDNFEIQGAWEGSTGAPGGEDLVSAASLPTDIGNLEQNGIIFEENVEIKLPSSITSALADDANHLANLGSILREQYSGIAAAAHELAKNGVGFTLASYGGRVFLILRDTSTTLKGDLGPFSLSQMRTVASNVMALVENHNATVDVIQTKFAEGKTSFQKQFNNIRTGRVGGRQRYIHLPSGYLGDLYDRRLGKLGLFFGR